jgi:hypothetical protein
MYANPKFVGLGYQQTVQYVQRGNGRKNTSNSEFQDTTTVMEGDPPSLYMVKSKSLLFYFNCNHYSLFCLVLLLECCSHFSGR